VEQGGAAPFDGDLDDYARWFTTREQNEAAPSATAGGVEADDKKQRKRAEAERRNRLSPLKNEVARTEAAIARLEQERAAIEQELASPEIYGADAKDRLRSLLESQTRVKREIETAEAAWFAANERLEAALCE
jgi:ATP-binding cassette, subfamily F, member 3